jgi:hypothetical protein
LAGPPGADAAQVPIVWPLAMVHVPVQQSPLAAHASPGCAQNDDSWHVPPEQRPEQQVELEEHALPMVEHIVLSGVQVPFVPQVWLQHWAPAVHGSLSDSHAG